MIRAEGNGVLGLFFNQPEGVFHIREIARLLGLHPNTIIKEVKKLAKSGLLEKKRVGNIVQVKANRENRLFFICKRLDNIKRLYNSGLVSHLNRVYNAPEAIILFGSYSRGEDTTKSDIDLAIITKRNLKIELGKYEKILKRRIQIFEMAIEKTDRNMLSSLANGIVLEGYLSLP